MPERQNVFAYTEPTPEGGYPAFLSLNINGVTRTRLALQFYNGTTGAAFALTTANIAAGELELA